ncbi:hypothetical protein BP6252_03280 [Coleophoma cylindrospora]|uniref:AP complex mu/sigma subunit domain-containing protein n=1 Tax=Coleophoma cylindrospora TaxID=1849047 RepID=A0A3D8S7A8_9HELO|nr:hypothetical protein BP6252_03280 [Coleophoma cylindrospora]
MVYHAVSQREGEDHQGCFPARAGQADENPDSKIVYRRYASLFFIAGCSSTDNELITLEIVHRYVEQMDKYYGNVCELDIIVWLPSKISGLSTDADRGQFNFQKAYFILDELLLAGEMQESSKKNVLRVISAQDSIEDTEVSDTHSPLNMELPAEECHRSFALYQQPAVISLPLTPTPFTSGTVEFGAQITSMVTASSMLSFLHLTNLDVICLQDNEALLNGLKDVGIVCRPGSSSVMRRHSRVQQRFQHPELAFQKAVKQHTCERLVARTWADSTGSVRNLRSLGCSAVASEPLFQGSWTPSLLRLAGWIPGVVFAVLGLAS